MQVFLCVFKIVCKCVPVPCGFDASGVCVRPLRSVSVTEEDEVMVLREELPG